MTKIAEAVARGTPLNQTFIAKTGHACGKAACILETKHADRWQTQRQRPDKGYPCRLIPFCFLKADFFFLFYRSYAEVVI